MNVLKRVPHKLKFLILYIISGYWPLTLFVIKMGDFTREELVFGETNQTNWVTGENMNNGHLFFPNIILMSNINT